jgi:hypothetical protein
MTSAPDHFFWGSASLMAWRASGVRYGRSREAEVHRPGSTLSECFQWRSMMEA